MEGEFVWAFSLCLFLLAYLTYTILHPEKF